MSLASMFKKSEDLDKALADMENEVEELVEVSIETPSLDPNEDQLAHEYANEVGPGDADSESKLITETAHTQSRLSVTSAFSARFDGMADNMNMMIAQMSEFAACERYVREFVDTVYTDIHRANGLEQANYRLKGELRQAAKRLLEQSKRADALDSELEQFQRREGSLRKEIEGLRETASEAKYGKMEAEHRATAAESEKTELQAMINAKNSENDKFMREVELLRNNQTVLTIDRDKAQKELEGVRRKLAEVEAVQNAGASRLSELTEELAEVDQERGQLHAAKRELQLELNEAEEARKAMLRGQEEEEKRLQAEIRTLKQDTQHLNSRLRVSQEGAQEASNELALLRAQISEFDLERKVLQENLLAMTRERDELRQNLSAANMQMSDLSLRRASDEIASDSQRQYVEELQKKIERLTAKLGIDGEGLNSREEAEVVGPMNEQGPSKS